MTRLFDTNVLSLFVERDAESRHPAVFAGVNAALESEEGVAVAGVTLYELRRGLRHAVEGENRQKRVRVEKVLRLLTPLGLDERGFAGWDLAAEIWRRARREKPAVVFSEGDLLIVATAMLHQCTLVTCDGKLADGLKRIGYQGPLEVLPV